MSQTSTRAKSQANNRTEPRWPAMLALLAVGGLRFALPDSLALGPVWLLLAVVGILLIPTTMARLRGSDRLTQTLGYILISVVTLDVVWSLALLLRALPAHTETPAQLLRSAAALWIANILIFASWYWRLDAGGPRARELRDVHTDGAFLFPQMTLDTQAKREMGEQCWSPGFVDYLFLAFNTSTAFSPTDCPVLSRWAKLLMMTQSLISFTTVALLAARAVNIL
jgi:multisubunit Na+/H+ antiporter MnhG subunit